MSRSRALDCRALGIAAALAASSAAAQEPTATAAPADAAPAAADAAASRTLAGHIFLPATLAPGPFATTSLTAQMILLGGSADAEIQVGDQTFSGTTEFAGLGAYAAYEYSFLEHYSVRAWLDDLVFSGISGKSVLVLGTEIQGGFGAGATAGLRLGDRVQAGVLLDAGYTPSVALTLAEALDAVEDSCEAGDCDVATGTAIEIENVLQVKPALSLAFAAARSLGITANAAYLYLEGEDDSATGVRLGAAVDFDLGMAIGFPVGLQGQFAWTAPVGDGGVQHVTDVGFGIFYTGRKELVAGLQVLGRRWSVEPGFADTQWNSYFTNFGLRYYWK
jgi:hypothetical protein